jgi:hypothetical protein
MIYNLWRIPAVPVARTAPSPLPVVTLAHIVDSNVRSDVNKMDGTGKWGEKPQRRLISQVSQVLESRYIGCFISE